MWWSEPIELNDSRVGSGWTPDVGRTIRGSPPRHLLGSAYGQCAGSRLNVGFQGFEFNPDRGSHAESQEPAGSATGFIGAVINGDFQQAHVIEQRDAVSIWYSPVMPVDSVHVHSAGTQRDAEIPVFPRLFECALINVGDEVAIGVNMQDDALYEVGSNEGPLPFAFDPMRGRTSDYRRYTSLYEMAGNLNENVALRKCENVAFRGDRDVIERIGFTVGNQ